jgi:hypothetical protein
MYSLALIIFVVSEKKAFEYFPIGSNVNLCPAVAALGQLKPNCPGMIIGRSSTNFCFLCRSEIQDGHLQQTYCSFNIGPYGKKCFKIFSSETSKPI